MANFWQAAAAVAVAALLGAASAGDATRIFIGAENKLFALSGSSVIAKPIRGHGGQVVGVIDDLPTCAELVERIDERTKALETLLAKHQRGDGWAPYTDLSTDEVKALSKALDALSEEVAKVAGVVGTR